MKVVFGSNIHYCKKYFRFYQESTKGHPQQIYVIYFYKSHKKRIFFLSMSDGSLICQNMGILKMKNIVINELYCDFFYMTKNLLTWYMYFQRSKNINKKEIGSQLYRNALSININITGVKNKDNNTFQRPKIILYDSHILR